MRGLCLHMHADESLFASVCFRHLLGSCKEFSHTKLTSFPTLRENNQTLSHHAKFSNPPVSTLFFDLKWYVLKIACVCACSRSLGVFALGEINTTRLPTDSLHLEKVMPQPNAEHFSPKSLWPKKSKTKKAKKNEIPFKILLHKLSMKEISVHFILDLKTRQHATYGHKVSL